MSPFLGVNPSLPADQYHATEALSASGLRDLRKSSLHYWARHMDPDREPLTPTPAMRNGTLVHCLVLEPDCFDQRYRVKPAGHDGRTKEGKAWVEASAGYELITEKEERAAVAQAAALRSLPEVAALLDDGQSEVSAFWIDPVTGMLCKCRPDKVAPAGNGVVLLDMKTTTDASPAGFAKAVTNLGYHLQAAHYSDGYALASGLPVKGFVFAVVESEAPYAVAAYMLDDEALSKARDLSLALRQAYAACKASNEWPGYSKTVEPLSLPPWAF